ncbi:hypothetical protein C4K39_4638 [Pseudomonas sessilinigenes]|nr:hypothetical protein C4K39_4638 [Pseudomonas sessilinigenes]
MGFNILLRNSKRLSYFKRYLLRMLKFEAVNEVVLCSGYFQEDLWGYSVLDDDVLQALKSKADNEKFKINFIAGKFKVDKKTQQVDSEDVWFPSYKNFLKRLNAEGVGFEAYIAKDKNWHAKVALFLINGVPIAGIVGSSNMTRPAVSETDTFFNFECDVVIWVGKYQLNKVFGGLADPVPDDPFSPIIAQVNPRYPQPKEDERLMAIYNEVMKLEDLESFDQWKD